MSVTRLLLCVRNDGVYDSFFHKTPFKSPKIDILLQKIMNIIDSIFTLFENIAIIAPMVVCMCSVLMKNRP